MMSESPEYQQIAAWLAASQGPVIAFTGAGISTESGIPDFRSPGGVWAKNQPVLYQDFLHSTAAQQEYWRQKCEANTDMAIAKPNIGHRTLANWEQLGLLTAVITQNIDGMHQLAGSQCVLELHGTARQIACLACDRRFDADPLVEEFRQTQLVPSCPECGGLLKHATISFGQSLPEYVINDAVVLSETAGVFLVIGSSLVVHPAASLPEIAKQAGAHLVIINRDPTPLDSLADAVIREPIGQALDSINRCLAANRP